MFFGNNFLVLIDFAPAHLYIGLIALGIILVILWQRNRRFSYLFFFSVFWIYLIGVVSVVVFPIHIPDIPLGASLHMNLALFDFGRCDLLILCIRNIYENILLTIPFGFGVSFIAQIKPKNILWLAMAVGLVFEITQLVISLVVHSPFRIVDINDVFLNSTGVLLGYGIFRIFGWLHSHLTDRFDIRHKYIFAYIYDVVCQSTDY